MRKARDLFFEIRDTSVNDGGPEAIQGFAQAFANEQAEKIARAIEHTPFIAAYECAAIARSTISKPMTREQRLEAALRDIAEGYNGHAAGGREVQDVARDALDGRDHD